MRIEGYIPHQIFKITVFKSGSKYLLKFEDGEFEIIWKLRDGSVDNFKQITNLVDHQMIGEIEKQFARLHRIRRDAFVRLEAVPPDENFEEII